MMRLICGLVVLVMMGCGDSSAFQAPISVPNGTGAQVRTNMNNALQALTTEQSGNTAPVTTYPYQRWIDTSTTPPTERIRNAANTGWLVAGTVDTSQYSAQRPFRGALVYDHPAMTPDGSNYVFAFTSEAYDTDNIHSTTVNSSRLTVPSGITKIRLSGQSFLQCGTSDGVVTLTIRKNGTGIYPGMGGIGNLCSGSSVWSVAEVSTPIISVTGGDYFELSPKSSTIPANSTGGTDWFAMEIIE